MGAIWQNRTITGLDTLFAANFDYKVNMAIIYVKLLDVALI